jgi:hypothetical protein
MSAGPLGKCSAYRTKRGTVPGRQSSIPNREVIVSQPELPAGDASLLARMMDLRAEEHELWDVQDLAAVLEHQLAAPLEADLGGLRPGLGGLLERLQPAGGPPIRTFKDLLDHPHPPLELLELCKQFGKRCRSNPDGPLPEDIATALYLASIAAAITRGGQRITKLADEGMRHGYRWALKQSWLDPSTRRLLEEGLKAFGGSASG